MRQDVACVLGPRRIDRDIVLVNVLNDAILINYERGPISVPAIFVVNAVVFDHRVLDVA